MPAVSKSQGEYIRNPPVFICLSGEAAIFLNILKDASHIPGYSSPLNTMRFAYFSADAHTAAVNDFAHADLLSYKKSERIEFTG